MTEETKIILLIVWLVLYPISGAIVERIEFGKVPIIKRKELYTDNVLAISGFVNMAIYFLVASRILE